MLSRRPALLPLLAAVLELVAVAAAADLSSATSQDACDQNGHVILDDWRRTPLYQPRSPRDVLCDRHLRPGWYRFTLNNRSAEIPTECASVNYCGTQAPLWLHLKGRKLPAANTEANFTACASWSLLDGHDAADHCCSLQLPVTVRNCSHFLVYYLTPTPGCNMAYCAHLAAGSLPFTFDGVPSIHPYVDDKKQIFLNCSVRHQSSSHQSVQFRFSWFRISGKDSIQTLLRTNVSSSSQDLLGRSLFSVGDRIICEVEALLDLESNHHEVVNPSVSSSPFHAGITVEPTYVNLYKNGSVHNVTISITMPFLCGTHVSSQDCHFSLNLDQKSASHLQIIGTSHCHLDLGSLDLNQTREGQFNISLSAVNDYIYHENSTVQIQLTLTSYGDSWWHGFTVPNITAKIIDTHSAQCYAFTLGHLITVDSVLKRIDSKGSHLLYGNPAQNLKVVADYQDCAGGEYQSFCVCAVKVAYHQDEFKIDHCSNEILPEQLEYFSSVRKQILPEISLRSKNSTKRLTVWESRQGKLLTVVMDTGSRVRIRIEPWGLSVSIIDGTVTDELKPIVNGLCTEKTDSEYSPVHVGDNDLCFCWPSKDLNCDPEFEFCPPTCQEWSPVRWMSFFNYIDITNEALVRVKESDSDDSLGDKRLRRHGSDVTLYSASLGKDIYWTTRSRRSLESIRDDDVFLYCSNYLVNSTIAIECGQFLNAAIMKAIEICMKDVTINADMRWATFSLGLLEDQCEVEAQFQQSQWPRDVLNQPVLPKSIIEALNCPNGCSGHGVCLDLGCVCQPGFSSLDCSIIDERPPQLNSQELMHFCDSSSRNCSRLSITGSTFIDSSQLTCRYWYGGLSQNNSWIREGKTRQNRAAFNDANNVTCELDTDFSRVYEEIFLEVQIGNDGSRFSHSVFVTVFDGRCRSCSQDDNNGTWPVCTDRDDVCVLDDQCFFNHEVNPRNSCQACSIEQSEQWSINEGNLPPFVLSDIKIVVYDGQDLVYQIPASDPDSDRLSFTLLDPVTDITIDETGRFWWKAVSNSLSVINREVFYIRISDNCNPPIETRLEIDVFPCPCDNGGSCRSSEEVDSDSNLIPTYVCNCPPGFTGKDCNVRIDLCASNPCAHGSCFPTPSSIVCRCDQGYTGELCDKDVELEPTLSPTEPHLDGHGSTRLIDIDVQVFPVMEDLEDSWNQSISFSNEDFESEWNNLPGFCSQPCKNGGVCVFPGICKCPLGQRGSRCHVNQCYPLCRNGGRCLKRNRCKCKEGFRGPSCELKSAPKCHPSCQNKGKCIANNVCQCRAGWAGDQCNIPLCEPPCQNGGVCWRPGKCACPHGFRGSRCTKPICSPPCQNGGKCLAPGTCKCKTAFGGSLCEIPLKKARRKAFKDHGNFL